MMKRLSMLLTGLALIAFAAGLSSTAGAADEAKTALLKNAKCPMTGKDVNAEKFINYADKDKSVYGRIYFCCENCQGKAKEKDAAGQKELYIKTFLLKQGKEGKDLEYGKTIVSINNEKCPVGGDDVVSDASINFNGFKIGTCCPMCTKGFVKDPDKYLSGLTKEITEAKEEAKKLKAEVN